MGQVERKTRFETLNRGFFLLGFPGREPRGEEGVAEGAHPWLPAGEGHVRRLGPRGAGAAPRTRDPLPGRRRGHRAPSWGQDHGHRRWGGNASVGAHRGPRARPAGLGVRGGRE